MTMVITMFELQISVDMQWFNSVLSCVQSNITEMNCTEMTNV